uniref:Reverse transcriptase domain-containing protein n=1 Tax=Angiostrongylus cantonensis TaxID=6313 RepID=A0A0K0D101_ANGCA
MEAAWITKNYVTICTYNARTLASESSIENLLWQARRMRNGIIGPAETRRRYQSSEVYDTGKELILKEATVDEAVRRRSRQHKFVDEHQSIRTTNSPNRTFTIEETWIDKGNLRRLRANTKF